MMEDWQNMHHPVKQPLEGCRPREKKNTRGKGGHANHNNTTMHLKAFLTLRCPKQCLFSITEENHKILLERTMSSALGEEWSERQVAHQRQMTGQTNEKVVSAVDATAAPKFAASQPFSPFQTGFHHQSSV